MAKSYDDMTDKQLEQANQKLGKERDTIREEQRKIWAVIDHRDAVRRSESAMEGLGPNEIRIIAETAAAQARSQN